jgi:hypothetical protein
MIRPAMVIAASSSAFLNATANRRQAPGWVPAYTTLKASI